MRCRDTAARLVGKLGPVLTEAVGAIEDRVSTVRCLVEDLSLLDQVLARSAPGSDETR